MPVKLAEKAISAAQVVENLKNALGENLEIKIQSRTDGVKTPSTFESVWLKVPHSLFAKAIDTLFEMDFAHFHIISGSDEVDADAVELRYHFSLFSYCGQNERVGVTVMVDVPKSNLVMPSLFARIPGSEYSEREIREMYGVDFDGLPNKALVFLPNKWDETIKPWREDNEGLSARPDMVRRLS